jgi:proline iminopeptidase
VESRDPITWETHVADLGALAVELRLQPLTIVGYSWGGLLAMLYAIRSSAEADAERWPRPRRLVLIDPAPADAAWRAKMEAEFNRRQASESVRNQRQQLSESGLRESDPDTYRRRLFELSVTGYFHDPEAVRDLTTFRVSGRIQESVWKSLGSYDITASLRQLSLPALVVHGRDDPIPVQSSIEVADALDARLLLLERCGHVPYVEQPRALFSAIERFLDDYPVHAPE